MRISDWSSDVCSSDLAGIHGARRMLRHHADHAAGIDATGQEGAERHVGHEADLHRFAHPLAQLDAGVVLFQARVRLEARSEEHTSELQSLMRISYDVFCLKKTNHTELIIHTINTRR